MTEHDRSTIQQDHSRQHDRSQRSPVGGADPLPLDTHDLLSEWGWTDQEAAAYAAIGDHEALRPARVVWQGRGGWVVQDGHGEHRVTASGRLRATAPDDRPVTGDWVAVRDRAVLTAVLPRRTSLRRKAVGRSQAQVVAANADLVGICAAATAVNPRRLERELVVAWESGATPLVIVTKADLVHPADLATTVEAVTALAVGVPVVTVCAPTGTGTAQLLEVLRPAGTVVFIGASGVGKSTLLNALQGSDLLATGAVRADGRGRHTTTSRHLVRLPGGELVLDTPGTRELGLWTDDDPGSLADAFSDVDRWAAHCRFADCSHGPEPGCAVTSAVASGEMPADRLASWHRLQRELVYVARSRDARLASEARRRHRAIVRQVRGTNRP